MSPEELYHILVKYINQILLVFNILVFIFLIKNRKNANPIIWGMFFILNLNSSIDSIYGFLYFFSSLRVKYEIIRLNYDLSEWYIFLLFYYYTESKIKIRNNIKYLIYFSLICSFTVVYINYFNNTYSDLYITDFKFFAVVPLAIYRLFEIPKDNLLFHPNFYINIAIFQVMTVSFSIDLFKITIYNYSKDLFYTNVFINWISYFAFFIILMIAFSKYPKQKTL